jgi:hypothetical protein
MEGGGTDYHVAGRPQTVYLRYSPGPNLRFKPSFLPTAGTLLAPFAKFRKVTINFVMFVRPSAYNNSAPTRLIFVKTVIAAVFETLSRKLKISLKSDNNNGYFTRRRFYIYDNISLICV